MELLDFLKSSRSILPISLVTGVVVWGVYTKFIPKKLNAIFVALILVSFVVLTSYSIIIGSVLRRYALAIVPIDLIVTYVFYWIFIKDSGANKKLL